MSIVAYRQARYDRYMNEETKIRGMITNSVPGHIMSEFGNTIPHPRDMLLKLKQSMCPDPKVTEHKTKEEYDEFIKRRWTQ